MNDKQQVRAQYALVTRQLVQSVLIESGIATMAYQIYSDWVVPKNAAVSRISMFTPQNTGKSRVKPEDWIPSTHL